jgi:predicted hydrocarbon binding protein
MHGIIHAELQRFVQQNHGHEVWHQLLERAGLQAEVYTPLQAYPDSHIMGLVKEAVALTGTPATDLLEGFGEFLVPTLLSVYGKLLEREWRTLDVLEHTEETIHTVVRVRQPGALPPKLKVRRSSNREVLVTYNSERRLCAVARGIIRGVAKEFRERVDIADIRCMNSGDPACLISVALKR